MNDRPRSLPTLLAAALILGLAACGSDAGPPPLEGATMRNAFTLTSHDGRRMSSDAFAGKYRIVYFGYTHCPDVCPVDLAAIGGALRQFEQRDPARAARLQPIFVTTDPERDTPQVLRRFVGAFHPRLMGFTGTTEEIGNAARTHGIMFDRLRPAAENREAYLVDHSRITVLYDPQGMPVALVHSDQGTAAVLEQLERWIR
jgi:protein SCO1/2